MLTNVITCSWCERPVVDSWEPTLQANMDGTLVHGAHCAGCIADGEEVWTDELLSADTIAYVPRAGDDTALMNLWAFPDDYLDLSPDDDISAD